MIELRGVTKLYGTKRAVDQLDLRVRAGELFAFLGPNGAGKTTTIKMVCGLLAPSAGTVWVGGHPATSSEEERQKDVWKELSVESDFRTPEGDRFSDLPIKMI